jgi:subtilisin family serine protease
MVKLLGLFLFVQAAFSLAPYNPQPRTVDRGLERSYIVVLKETVVPTSPEVQAWLRNEIPGADLSNVRHVYDFGSFRGFSIWLNEAGLLAVRQSSFVKYVDANGYASILPIQNQPTVSANATSQVFIPFTERPDWGQVRVDQVARSLLTNPANLYANGNYANGGATDWIWDGPTFTPDNSGENTLIWILDTGVLLIHNEFISEDGKSRVTEVVNIIGDTSAPLGDCNGHGTHCAGTAAGRFRGVSSKAEIKGVRVLSCGGSGTWDDVIKGVQHIANNQNPKKANILSASLGGGRILSVNAAFDAAADLGIISVVAAGNSNADAANYSPASAAGVITVGATDVTDTIAYFSSWGATLNVFAPGVNIHSAYIGSPSAYATLSGTSMATPLVTGSLAQILTEYPDLLFKEVVGLINSNSIKGKVLGLTGLKAASPNQFIYDKWVTQSRK